MRRSILTSAFALALAAIWLAAAVPVMAATEQQKQVAINEGLAWLAESQTVSGDEGYWSYNNDGTLAATAAAALAFIEEGHMPGDNVMLVLGDPPDTVHFGDVVGRAVTYIFNRATFDPRFGVETAVYERYAEDYDDDNIYDDGNDLAIFFDPSSSGRNVYTTGICTPVVFALGEALGIFTEIETGSAAVNGRTYRDVMQDIVDWFCFAQVEPDRGNYRGGWRYDANYATADNSTAQWGALPPLYADAWGLGTSDFVYYELELWVNYIQNANGGSGYDNPNSYVNVSKTGGLLLELAAISADFADARVQNAMSFIDSHWNDVANNTYYGNLNHPYAMWAVYKGLEVYDQTDVFESMGHYVRYGFGMPSAPGGFEIGNEGETTASAAGDWFSHYCEYLVGVQNADGSWSGYSHWYGSMATGWYINILNASPGGNQPHDPDILIISTFEGDCPAHGTEVTHDILYWFGTPGSPDSTVVPAEDVTVTITLDPHMVFISATGDYAYDDTCSVTWYEEQIADGDDYRFESIVTEVASAALPETELVTMADISASNVPEERWDHDESRIQTCPQYCVIASFGEPVFEDGHITVPLILGNTDGQTPITGMDVIVTYDPAIVEATGADLEGGVLDGLGWAPFWNVPEPGEFRLGLAGVDPVPMDGVVAYLGFDVVTLCGGSTEWTLAIVLNEGDPCVDVIDPANYYLPIPQISGDVWYWGCGHVGNDYPPIEGVTVTSDTTGRWLTETFKTSARSRATADTDSAGHYSLAACLYDCYTLSATADSGETDGISILDAALILRHYVGLQDLMDCPIEAMELYDGSTCPDEVVYPQLVVADVTGNGAIQSYDASVVMQYLVGGDVSGTKIGEWEFVCATREVCVDVHLIDGQDFVGLLYGDVSGSWHMPWPATDDNSNAELLVARVEGSPGSTIEVPVNLEGADGFYGIQFEVEHDPSLVEVVDVLGSELSSGCLFEWNATETGVNVAVASFGGITGDGELCRIVYSVDPEAAGEVCELPAVAHVDEQPEPLSTVAGEISCLITGVDESDGVPLTFRLHAAIPNPFNPVTTIHYDVPADGGEVWIYVYDVTGRLVDTLVDEWKNAGTHSVSWSGVDSSERGMASGIYFCRMIAGDREMSRKLTLLK